MSEEGRALLTEVAELETAAGAGFEIVLERISLLLSEMGYTESEMPLGKSPPRASLEVSLKGVRLLFISKVDSDIYLPWARFGSGLTFSGVMFG